MKTFAFRHTLGLGIAAALLGGYGAAANGTQPPIVAGTLYKTTVNGGSGGGTVFKMSASGRGRG
jgi:hypothetical protein